MPFDPRISLAAQAPKFSSPLDDYAKFMSLRDLVDQRRVRDLQVRRLELQEQEAAREQEEYQRLQTALPSLGPESSLTDWMKAGGVKAGISGFKAQNEALKAQRDAAESAAKADKERLEAENRRNLMLANTAESLKYLGDNPELQQSEYKRAAPYFQKSGWITPEQAAAPLDMNMVDALIVRGGGAKRLEDVRNDIAKRGEEKAKAARETSLGQIQLAGHYIGTVSDQPSYERWSSMLPLELRGVLDKAYSPEGMERAKSVMLTAQQRAAEERQAQPNAVGDFIRIATDPKSSREDQERADKALAMFATQAKAGSPTTIIGPHQKVGDEAKLRDDFRQESKNYTVLRDAFTKIKGASESQTGPGDISLVYGYMRMLDPGSTVREGEFATAQNAGSIPQRITAMYNKALNGERLDPAIRSQFVSEANKIYSQSLEDHKKIRDRYRDITTRSGLDPENVVIDYSPAPVPGTPAPKQQTGGAPSAGGVPNPIMKPGEVLVKAPDGKTYSFPNAAAADVFKKRAGIK